MLSQAFKSQRVVLWPLQTQREVMDLLRKTVRPEFLNHVDEPIMFRPLCDSEDPKFLRLH